MSKRKSWFRTVILLGITFFAPVLTQAQLTFTTNSSAITITGYTGSPTVLDIPGSTNGYPVTSIGNNAFSGKSTLTVVTIPSGITNIGSFAFQGCFALSSITIPDSVNTIGNSAFNACNNATNLVIGHGVTRINTGVFQSCSKLGTVLIPDSVTNINASAFSTCNLLTNIMIGSNVTIIGASAFQNCSKLGTILFPASVTNIGASAFSGCGALNGAFFNGNAPTNASSTIFSGDNSATVFYLTNTVGWGTTFGGVPTMLWNPQLQCGYTTNGGVIKIARYTGSDSSVTIPGTLNGLPITSIGNNAFQNATQLMSIALPGSITNIGSSAFFGSGVTSFIASGSLITIGGSAFQSCLNLTNVMISSSVTNIGGSAFFDCHILRAITVDALNPDYSSLGGVLFDKAQTTLIQCPGGITGGCPIPSTTTDIVSTALTDNPGLGAINVDTLNPSYSSVDGVLLDKAQTTLLQYPQGKQGNYTVPGTVTDIVDNAFASSVGLTGVIVGDSVLNLGDQAFEGCDNLTNALIGNQVARIGYFAFNFCHHLATVSLGNSISSIKSGAFQGCAGLTGIVLPYGVTDIGSYAFNQCGSMTSIVIPNTVASIGDYAFISCSSLASITIPDSVTSMGMDIFGGCIHMTSVTVGKGLANIPDWTFQSCPSLTAIYFRGDAPSFGAHVFDFSSTPPVYCLPGTIGWGPTFDGLPVVLWNPQGANFGVQANQFGFSITGSSNLVVVVEACTNPATAVWSPVSTNTLNSLIGTNGTSYFSDPQWTNYPTRFYRFRAP